MPIRTPLTIYEVINQSKYWHTRQPTDTRLRAVFLMRKMNKLMSNSTQVNFLSVNRKLKFLLAKSNLTNLEHHSFHHKSHSAFQFIKINQINIDLHKLLISISVCIEIYTKKVIRL